MLSKKINCYKKNVIMLISDTLFNAYQYNLKIATSPTPREYRIGWNDAHLKHIKIAKESNTKILLIGDSIIHGLTRYANVWYKYFAKKSALNFGIPGDRTQHVLWRIENLTLPDSLEIAIVLIGTNNLDNDPPEEIANATLLIAYTLLKKHPNVKVILSGILPRGHESSKKRKVIEKVNIILSKECYNKQNIIFLDHSGEWTKSNGQLKDDLFFKDHVHLIEAGNMKLANMLVNAIPSVKKVQSVPLKDKSSLYKDMVYSQFCFKEEEFPNLPFPLKCMYDSRSANNNKRNERLYTSITQQSPSRKSKKNIKCCNLSKQSRHLPSKPSITKIFSPPSASLPTSALPSSSPSSSSSSPSSSSSSSSSSSTSSSS